MAGSLCGSLFVGKGKGSLLCDHVWLRYRIMDEEYQKSKTDLVDFLKMLLDSSLTDRMKSAEEQSNQGIIAELSLYLHPASIMVLPICQKSAYSKDPTRQIF